MIISKIEQAKKNKERVNVYSEGEYAFSLYIDTAIAHGIRAGAEIDDSELKSIAQEDEKLYGVKTALKYVSYKMRSSGEVRRKLGEKQISKSAADYAVEELTKMGYLNDDEYARLYVEELKHSKGRIDIEERLLYKGIPKEIARKYLKNIDQSETVKEMALALKAKWSGLDKYKAKQKIFTNLMGKGFDFGEIKSAVSEIYGSEEEYYD